MSLDFIFNETYGRIGDHFSNRSVSYIFSIMFFVCTGCG